MCRSGPDIFTERAGVIRHGEFPWPRRADVATASYTQMPHPIATLLLSCIPAAAASVAGMLLETESGIYRPFRATGRGYPVPRQLNARHKVGRRSPP